jgi:LPXTG-site transpeptidase (sortase) family protein
MLVGGCVSALGWYEHQQWQTSPDAARAERNLDAPRPIWITPEPQAAGAAAPGPDTGLGTPTPLPRVAAAAPATSTGAAAPAAMSETEPAAGSAAAPAEDTDPSTAPGRPAPTTGPPAPARPVATLAPTVAPTPTPAPLQKLVSSDFRFLDPPQPGARAHLTVSIQNTADRASGPIQVALPLGWLAGYEIRAAAPVPDGSPETGVTVGQERRVTFEGLEPGDVQDLTIDLVTTDEVIDAPALRVLDARGVEIGRAHPETLAPPAQPGPVYALDVPKLNIRSAVVPVDWEPPLFVVGQIRGSAYVTQGNTVLVGHVRGQLGNVFDRLDQLTPGDQVIARSRGQEYSFTVTDKEVLPPDDTSPVGPTTSPRLTLMTCTGLFDPINRDYSDRLWVIAEPSDAVAAMGGPQAAATEAAVRSYTPTPTPTRPPPAPVAAGGPGDTNHEIVAAFGAPTGQGPNGLAVYHKQGVEYRVAYADTPDGAASRALLVARVLPTPVQLTDATRLARGLLPADAHPRGRGVEGNQRFAVERFTSPTLASVLPPDWFTSRGGEAGDVVAVYARGADGKITSVVVGIGDDPDALLEAVGRG